MNLTNIRAAISDALTGNGLRVYDTIPPKLEPPAAAVALAAGAPNLDFDGAFDVGWVIVILLTRSDDVRSQRALDELLSSDGVHAWIAADPTLDGTVDYAVVTGWEPPGPYDYGGTSYVGVEVSLQTVAE